MNIKRKPGKASQGINKVIHTWLEQHIRAFFLSFGNLLKNPMGNLFTTAVIGVALALPAGFYLILHNAGQVIQNWEGNIQIAAYLQPNVSDEKARLFQNELAKLDSIESITLISKDQALEEYKTLSGFAEALDSLEENPLPSMLLIYPKLKTFSGQGGEELLNHLGAMPEIESAQLDSQWVKRLIVILNLMERAVIVLATLLSVAVLLIIGNTIRLSIINYRTEIEINKLFGATNSFIQRPFLYTGLIFGICGGLVSWTLILISTLIMQEPVKQLAILYNSDFSLQGFKIRELLILLASGATLGLIGSWIAVGRHLKDLEPQ